MRLKISFNAEFCYEVKATLGLQKPRPFADCGAIRPQRTRVEGRRRESTMEESSQASEMLEDLQHFM
jgi:hypothetical protein